MNRRGFLSGLLGTLPLAVWSRPAAAQPGADRRRRAQSGGPVAIASGNGLVAVERALRLATGGGDPTAAAVAGVNLVELDPEDDSVGYGGLPNFDGVVQLDAAVMHGPSGKGGAVACLEGVKMPSKVAQLVMERTDHVLLVAEGARRFATMHGFPVEDLLTERSRKIWLYWRENLSDKDDWEEPPVAALDPEIRAWVERNRSSLRTPSRPTGTIHLSVLTPGGDLGCCTTTSGLAFKIPGRVGDSPLIGCGLYCDNDIGSAGATGRGEASILSNAGQTIVELMRQGRSPEAACLGTLERVVHRNRDSRLRRPDGKPNFNLRLYAVSKSGDYGSAAIFSGGKFAVATPEGGARLEDQAFLYE